MLSPKLPARYLPRQRSTPGAPVNAASRYAGRLSAARLTPGSTVYALDEKLELAVAA